MRPPTALPGFLPSSSDEPTRPKRRKPRALSRRGEVNEGLVAQACHTTRRTANG